MQTTDADPLAFTEEDRRFFTEVKGEQLYQRSMYDEEQDLRHSPHDWMTFITHYATRHYAVDPEAGYDSEAGYDLEAIREDFVKVAALAKSAAEALDEKIDQD